MVNHPNRKRILLTLQDIRDAHPCAEGWAKLLKALPPKSPMTTRLSLGDVAAANDAADALWCCRALDWSDISIRRRVIGGAILPAATRALRFTQDVRVHACVNAVALWADGDDSVDLREAEAAARSAWSAEAAWSAWSARSARSAARSARSAWSAWSAWSAEAAAARSAWSAERSAEAAEAAAAAERTQQVADVIRAFPPVVLIAA